MNFLLFFGVGVEVGERGDEGDGEGDGEEEEEEEEEEEVATKRIIAVCFMVDRDIDVKAEKALAAGVNIRRIMIAKMR